MKIQEKMMAEIGEVLKQQRSKIGVSQKEIAKRLGYRNVNFVSMMESGASLIPAARIRDIVLAYEMQEEMTIIVFAFINKPVWDAMLKSNKNFSQRDEPELVEMFKSCWAHYEKLCKSLFIKTTFRYETFVQWQNNAI